MVVVKEKKNVIWYLKKDKKYFLREFTYVKPLLEEEHKIANTLHDFAKRKRNIELLEEMESQLNKLERRERWQQIRSSFSKLKKAMNRLLKSPYLSAKAKMQITTLMPKFEIYERDLLKETKIELDSLIRDKKLFQIDWKRVTETTERLLRDIQDLLILDKKIEELVEG